MKLGLVMRAPSMHRGFFVVVNEVRVKSRTAVTNGNLAQACTMDRVYTQHRRRS